MSSNTYDHFAIAGAGTIGRTVLSELINNKNARKLSSITILTRSPGCHDDLVEQGVRVLLVDYSRPSSLVSALTGIDVVVSTLSLLSINLEYVLAVSAQEAGVKLFVPSDFESHPSEETNFPLLKHKAVIRKKLQDIGLPFAIFYTGLFPDKILAPAVAAALGFDFVVGEFSIPGSGDAPISWTTSGEIAQIIAYALTTFTRDRLEWSTFRIEGDRISFNEIVSLWEKRFRKIAIVFHRPRSVFKEAVKRNPVDILSAFILEIDAGHMAVGKPDEVANDEFPEWRPIKVIDVLDEMYREC